MRIWFIALCLVLGPSLYGQEAAPPDKDNSNIDGLITSLKESYRVLLGRSVARGMIPDYDENAARILKELGKMGPSAEKAVPTIKRFLQPDNPYNWYPGTRVYRLTKAATNALNKIGTEEALRAIKEYETGVKLAQKQATAGAKTAAKKNDDLMAFDRRGDGFSVGLCLSRDSTTGDVHTRQFCQDRHPRTKSCACPSGERQLFTREQTLPGLKDCTFRVFSCAK